MCVCGVVRIFARFAGFILFYGKLYQTIKTTRQTRNRTKICVYRKKVVNLHKFYKTHILWDEHLTKQKQSSSKLAALVRCRHMLAKRAQIARTAHCMNITAKRLYAVSIAILP